MREKKTMKLGFMLTMLALLLAITLGIFLPYLTISGDRVKKAWEELMEDNEILEQASGQIDDAIDNIDEKISISGWQIMTELGDQEVPEGIDNYDAIVDFVDGMKVLQAFLGIFYGMAVLLFVLLILGYFLRWNRFTLSVLVTVYSVAGAVFFWYLLWGIPGIITDYLPKEIRNGLLGDISEKVVQIFWKAIRGNALLPTFILLLVLFVVSILSMLISDRFSYATPVFAAPGSGGMPGMDAAGQIPVNPIPSPPLPGGPFFPDNNQNTLPVDPSIMPGPQPVYKPQPLPQPPVQQNIMGSVRCTEGTAIGQGYRLPEGRKVIVGKSPQRATLVINNPHISNVHCSIRYNAVKNMYIVKDHSMNGTFVNGMRLQNGIAAEYPAGTVLSLADGANKITLG